MTDWCSRPLDGVYAAILVDAVMVKGQGRAGGQPAHLRRHRRHLGRAAGHPGAQVEAHSGDPAIMPEEPVGGTEQMWMLSDPGT